MTTIASNQDRNTQEAKMNAILIKLQILQQPKVKYSDFIHVIVCYSLVCL